MYKAVKFDFTFQSFAPPPPGSESLHSVFVLFLFVEQFALHGFEQLLRLAVLQVQLRVEVALRHLSYFFELLDHFREGGHWEIILVMADISPNFISNRNRCLLLLL